MRIQFELGMTSHKRHFETVIEELKARKHHLIVTSCTKDCPGLVKRNFGKSSHREMISFYAYVRDDDWQNVSYLTRVARDFLRYLLPEHASSAIIKDRTRKMLLSGLSEISSKVGFEFDRLFSEIKSEQCIWALDRTLQQYEDLIPPHKKIVQYISKINPDVLCVTPMVISQYGQAELVKAAKFLNIPVVYLAYSWDNLTTKGTVHITPTSTLVWNEIQKNEAQRYHQIPADTISLVGAARFDEFWVRETKINRIEYCQLHGFDPEKPILTYLCSSNLIIADEKGFVARWIDAIRSARETQMSTANILIRPHPKFSTGWVEAFNGLAGVGISTSKGLNNDAELFHCLAHSRAVIGANTSAELEAAILDVPVFSVRDPEFELGQKGTIHFGYLAGKLANVSDSLSEHIAQLHLELKCPHPSKNNDKFLTSFIRPNGLEIRPTDVIADYIESNFTQINNNTPQ